MENTTFNRNLVANILYIMDRQGIITEQNATALTVALEDDKDHPSVHNCVPSPIIRRLLGRWKSY